MGIGMGRRHERRAASETRKGRQGSVPEGKGFYAPKDPSSGKEPPGTEPPQSSEPPQSAARQSADVIQRRDDAEQ